MGMKLLIEPYGIETNKQLKEDGRGVLLIEPYGIETLERSVIRQYG